MYLSKKITGHVELCSTKINIRKKAFFNFEISFVKLNGSFYFKKCITTSLTTFS